MRGSTVLLSKSSPPKCLSPAVAFTPKTPSSMVRGETSKVLPPIPTMRTSRSPLPSSSNHKRSPLRLACKLYAITPSSWRIAHTTSCSRILPGDLCQHLEALLNQVLLNHSQDFVQLQGLAGNVQWQVLGGHDTFRPGEPLWHALVTIIHDKRTAYVKV